MATKHRLDIDGLRAVAVLPILFFHAGIPYFSGGYVGVDIFYVISGFLITGIIYREVVEKRFSLIAFYERRVRRIFPALLAILFFTTIAACLILVPSDLRSFPGTVVGALLFVSNIVFWRQSGYFDGAAADKPLLHTWSLGVEEQFYIFVPLMIILIVRFFPRRPIVAVGVCAAISLGLCVVVTPVNASAAFYLIPTRAWELFAGSLLAIFEYRYGALPGPKGILAAVGLVMIGVAVFAFTPATLFPGYAAILPVAGSALILAYAQETPIGALLSTGGMTFIGRISYSLYLWHWPLIVFARYLGWLDDSVMRAGGMVLLSIGAAYLSWRYVEQPFRQRDRFHTKRIFRLAGIGAIVTLVYSVVLIGAHGLPQRFSPTALAFDRAHSDFSPMREACHKSKGLPDPAKACTFGGAPATTAMWADSHGVELSYALASPQHPLLSITYSACPPVIGFLDNGRGNCRRHNDQVLTFLEHTPRISTVILTAYYELYVDSPDFARHLGQTIELLRKAGKTVIVIGPVPHPGADVPRILALGRPTDFPKAQFDHASAAELALMRTAHDAGADIFLPSDFLCDADRCHLIVDGKPAIFDQHHLSMTGARYLARRFNWIG